MAEEFTISIELEADATKFRQQVRSELDAVAKTPATVPVQSGAGGGAAPGAPAVTGPGISSPQAAALSQAAVDRAMVQATTNVAYGPNASGAAYVAAARAGVPFNPNGWQALHPGGWNAINNGWQALNPGGWAAVNAAGGGFGVGSPQFAPGAQPVQPPAPAPIPAPPPPSPIPPSPPAATRGWNTGRYLALYGMHALARTAMASMDHEREVREAEGDPRTLAMADVQYRRNIANAFPIAGQIGLALNEAFTGGEEAVETTLRDAARTDRGTASMERAAATHTRFRDAGALARERDPVARQRLATQQAYDSADRTIRDEQRKREGAILADYQADKAKLEDKVRVAESGDPTLGGAASLEQRRRAEEDANQQRQALDKSRDEALKRVREQFDRDRQEAGAVRDSANVDIDQEQRARSAESFYGVRAADLRAANMPYRSGLALLRGTARAAYIRAEGDQDEQDRVADQYTADVEAYKADEGRRNAVERAGLEGEISASRYHRQRQPLLEGIARLRGQRDRALAALPADSPNRALTIERYRQREEEFKQDFGDTGALRTMGLAAQEEITGLQAAGQEKTARARDIQRRAEMEAEEARRSGRPEDVRSITQAAINQERTYLRELQRRAEAGSTFTAAAGQYGPGPSSTTQQEQVVPAIKNVEKAINDLTAALTGAP